MKRILITDITDPVLQKTLEENNFKVDYLPDIRQTEIEFIINQYHGIIITTKISFPKSILEKATQLEFIARAGSGMDHVDVAFAQSKNIFCITSPEGNAGSVGEHCVAMLLAIQHKIISANESVKKYQWHTDEFRVSELNGKTIGIIGYGNTGHEFAKRMKAFGVNILAYDKYKTNFSDDYVTESSMDKIFNEADIFSIHLPLTTETNNLINYAFLKSFKKKIILLNTSRGYILNLNDLLRSIDYDIVQAAALDVLDNENFKIHSDKEKDFHQKLFLQSKIIFTPHIAGKSHQTRFQHAQVLAKKILSFYKL